MLLQENVYTDIYKRKRRVHCVIDGDVLKGS